MRYNAFAKVFIFLIAFIIVVGITQFLGLVVLGVSLNNISSPDYDMSLSEHVVTEILSAFAIYGLVVLFFKLGNETNYLKSSLSCKKQKKNILKSALITASIIIIGFLFIWLVGWIEVELSSITTVDFLLMALLFIAVSFVEEVVIRGYILHTLMNGMNKYWALIISSSIFSLMHVANPNGTLLGFINLWLAGLFLGIVYVHTKNLWFALTAHFLWNFMQSPVLGFNVSGRELPTLLKIEYLNHDMWTGGEFGFEGSFICTILSILAIILLDIHYRKKTKPVTVETV